MKIIKKVGAVIFSMLLALSAFSFSACERIDIATVNFKANGVSYSMDVNLYTYLAPKTVEVIKGYIEEGYYNNALLYVDDAYGTQIMVGNYKLDGENIVANSVKSSIEGEFETNGYTFKNKDKVDFPLVNKKGALGLWRNWYAVDSADSYKASNSKNTGSSLLYMPTDTLSAYDGYFCVFGKIDLESEASSSAFSALTAVFSDTANYTLYAIYNTEEKEGEETKLVEHIIKNADYSNLSSDEKDNVYKAEGKDFTSLNKKTVKFSLSTYIESVILK